MLKEFPYTKVTVERKLPGEDFPEIFSIEKGSSWGVNIDIMLNTFYSILLSMGFEEKDIIQRMEEYLKDYKE